MEYPNTVQNWSTNILALITKTKNKIGIHRLENTSQIQGTQDWRRWDEDIEEWRHLLKEVRAQTGL